MKTKPKDVDLFSLDKAVARQMEAMNEESKDVQRRGVAVASASGLKSINFVFILFIIISFILIGEFSA